jgi:adenine-specific DNA-methyltransferase
MESKSKNLGQVNTPDWIVKKILDMSGYSGKSILDKYIMEPSCGDGAFLIEIVKRYITEALYHNISVNNIINNLSKFIYGIEIDKVEYDKCIKNLDYLVSDVFGDCKVNWNIYNEDTFNVRQLFNNTFDYVVGNPPYIRIHHIDKNERESIKGRFKFTNGTIDAYILFFEAALDMLNENGVVGYITPNSYFRNSSYRSFREYLKEEKFIKSVVDFKAKKVFDKKSTYTAITILNKSISDTFDYYELVENDIVKTNTIKYSELQNKSWNLASENDSTKLNKLNKIDNNLHYNVQYGIATLRDKIFIGKAGEVDSDGLVSFNGERIEASILKNVIKGSKFSRLKIIFPYEFIDNKYVIISEEKLISKYPNCYLYLQKNKNELLSRDIDKGSPWYAFGRSQSINTTNSEKLMVSSFVGDKINFTKVESGDLVTSGLIITKNSSNETWDEIQAVLNSTAFYSYLKLTGKHLSGGYNSVTPKQIKEFIK